MPAVEAIALSIPIIASSLPFAFRRVNKGLDEIDNNPAFGTVNMLIASGQALKAAKAAKNATLNANPSAADSIKELSNAMKGVAGSNKFLKYTGRVIDFTSRKINPIIIAASGIKVLGSDDKADAAVREISALSCMFGAEKLAKNIMGMSYMVKENGKEVFKQRAALYAKNPFLNKQVNALKDYCATKKLFNKISLKNAPAIAKGVLFVGASVAGYKIGTEVANLILGEKKKNVIGKAA